MWTAGQRHKSVVNHCSQNFYVMLDQVQDGVLTSVLPINSQGALRGINFSSDQLVRVEIFTPTGSALNQVGMSSLSFLLSLVYSDAF